MKRGIPVTEEDAAQRQRAFEIQQLSERELFTMMREDIAMKHSDILKTAAFTGHRPEKLPWGQDEDTVSARAFREHLKDVLTELIGTGCVNFLSGAARGFDTIAAETVLELREEYPWVSLTVVLPCDDQAARWREADRARWERLVQHADHVLHMTDRYDKGCMFRRNRYLVDNSSLLIAACEDGALGDSVSSGTAMTLAYAAEKSRTVIRIPLAVRGASEESLSVPAKEIA